MAEFDTVGGSGEGLWVWYRIYVKNETDYIENVKERDVLDMFGGMEKVGFNVEKIFDVDEELTEIGERIGFNFKPEYKIHSKWDMIPSGREKNGYRLIYDIYMRWEIDGWLGIDDIEDQREYIEGRMEDAFPGMGVLEGFSRVRNDEPIIEQSDLTINIITNG